MNSKLFLLVSLLSPAPALAQPAPARVEVPIREVVLPDGIRRYAVTVTIDGARVDAQLDTGSTGLRVLRAALTGPAATATGASSTYSYGSGVRFDGIRVRAAVAIGALSGDVPLERIDRVGCVQRQPDCPGERLDAAQYRIGGDGLPGQGFVAIVGAGLRADPVENPFAALGVRRWIVELPHGDAPGRLILNPTAEETARYRSFQLVGNSNQIAGCLVRIADAKRICGPAMVDTGASGLRVQGARPSDIWAQGTPAAIALGDDAGVVSFPVTIGRRDQASGMFAEPKRANGDAITLNLGLAPFFHWSILFDAGARRIGVVDRDPAGA